MDTFATLVAVDLADVSAQTRRLEEIGFDGVFTAETSHDVFLPLVLAAEHTTLRLGTCIAVAFPRSPVHLAHVATDIHRLSKGRFFLGLGSQIKVHVQKRYSAAWDHPVARMSELVEATKAIFRCWQSGGPLNFRGAYYRHTLMPPFFNPGPSAFGAPPILLAGVGERMTEAAGLVADGLLLHAFTTERYVRDVSLPAFDRGLTRSNRTRDDVEIFIPLFVVTGSTEEEYGLMATVVRQQLAFYASTPNYRAVLQRHGWEELQPELNTLSQLGRWSDMGRLITDEMLDTFAVCGSFSEIAPKVLSRYGDLVNSVGLVSHYGSDPTQWADVVAAVKAGSPARHATAVGPVQR